MTELSLLQEHCESRLSELLQRIGRHLDERELYEALVPFYSPKPFNVLKLRSEDIEVWVYDDEVSFSAREGGRGFELRDYKSVEDLLDAVFLAIEKAL
ncbi:MAG TPA: hypothetical protein PLJ23_00040 [Gemmatimonadales bacterium]|nr:hypothetical protein [Gemmatimonadales bacterium]